MSRYQLRDSDYSFNASLDPFLVLKRMGFTESSIYQEGNIIRIHCPIHKDLVRKSMIIDIEERTFKCQYTQCEAAEGGLLVELVAMYYDCELDEVTKNLFGDEDKSSDLLFRGEMYINQGMHAEALPYLEQAVHLDPRNEITRCKLAALLLELNRKDDAFKEYMAAAESYAVRGELENTLSIYNILIVLQPGAVKARKELAFLFSRMGRPDAAAEQLKWVVDFYMQYNQVRGAQEAVSSMLELQPNDGMCHFLMAQIHQQAGRRMQAQREFETAAELLLESDQSTRAYTAVVEGLKITPGNEKLKAIRDQLNEMGIAAQADQQQSEQENLMDWLGDQDHMAEPLELKENATQDEIDEQLSQIFSEQQGEPLQVTTPQVPDNAQQPPPAPPPADSGEITAEDRRVQLCLKDLEQLSADQIEQLRQQLVGMFTDVRKTYEDGLISDWEMKAIKDFYKSFCIAVDINRRQGSQVG